MIRLAFILFLTSCTVPRLTAPTVDDLAGCPMVMYPTLNLSEIPNSCDHFYIKQAHTINDTIQAGADYQACICIYCKEINVCK